MLTPDTIRQVTDETLEYWRNEVTKQYFVELAQGKEIGHKLADTVDEKTTALLTVNHRIGYERDSAGRKRPRSMGDVWLLDGAIYHPINVKTGVVGSEGQPNLVSLKKILSAITARQIDSYYLLIVKVALFPDGRTIEPSVVFTDMLDWLDYITFDAGPGQMMLKAKAFFSAYAPLHGPRNTLPEKLRRLFDLYEDGDRRLRENRDFALAKYRNAVDGFLAQRDWSVTPKTQDSLLLQ